MNAVIAATSPVDRDDLMRLFGDALIDARRTLDSVQDRIAYVRLCMYALRTPCVNRCGFCSC